MIVCAKHSSGAPLAMFNLAAISWCASETKQLPFTG
jgi:hypothetical protein